MQKLNSFFRSYTFKSDIKIKPFQYIAHIANWVYTEVMMVTELLANLFKAQEHLMKGPGEKTVKKDDVNQPIKF